jgi:hypothetical protein
LRKLIDEERVLTQRRAALEQTHGEERDSLARLDSLSQTRAHVSDPAPLREQWRALDVLKAIADHERKATSLRREEEALRRDALRLQPPVADLPRLAATAAPSAEVIAAFGERFDEMQTARRDGREELLALTQCTALCARLIDEGVEDLHFYTLNRPQLTRDVCHALGITAPAALEKVA